MKNQESKMLPGENTPNQYYSHFGRSNSAVGNQPTSRLDRLRALCSKYGPLFLVKPLTVIYFMSFMVTESVTMQLWIDRTCRNNLNFTEEVCSHLTSEGNEEYNDAVQKQVNYYKLYSTYMDNIPGVIIPLYLGPLSDRARKPMLLIPFLGHLVSGTCMICNAVFTTWDARFIWLNETYMFCGGYYLLRVAMYGYIGDVSTPSERTVLFAILSAMAMVMMPFADFCGGQIFKVGGYLPVYITSLGFIFLGIFYVWIIPESIKKSSPEEETGEQFLIAKTDSSAGNKHVLRKVGEFFTTANMELANSVKTVFRKRRFGERRIIIAMILLSLTSGMRPSTNGLLYTQKMFGWTVTDYTNYQSFMVVHICVKGFIMMPFLCYYLQVHDCIIAITGYLSGIEEYLVWAFATKGWHMYFGSALSALSGSRGVSQTSIISKCVPNNQLGKLFAFSNAIQTLFSMALTYVNTLLYNATLEGFLGASYCLSAGLEFLNMVGNAAIYVYIWRNEREFGPLGSREEDEDENKEK